MFDFPFPVTIPQSRNRTSNYHKESFNEIMKAMNNQKLQPTVTFPELLPLICHWKLLDPWYVLQCHTLI